MPRAWIGVKTLAGDDSPTVRITGRVLVVAAPTNETGRSLDLGPEQRSQSFDVGRVEYQGCSICGHNLRSFDLPYLWQRAWVNGLNPGPPPQRTQLLDTMEAWWCGLKWGKDVLISLDAICTALGIEGKGEIDGSKVWDVWQEEGGPDRVLEYCAEDVRRVREIRLRLQPWV